MKNATQITTNPTQNRIAPQPTAAAIVTIQRTALTLRCCLISHASEEGAVSVWVKKCSHPPAPRVLARLEPRRGMCVV